jgi:siroheme synthase-like protein
MWPSRPEGFLMDEAAAFPLFLRLDGRRVLVVGGGSVALEKASALRRAGARVRVVAPEIQTGFARMAESVEARPFVGADIDDAWLVIAAATPEVNRRVRLAADAKRVFVVAVDDVENCSAIGAAQLRRGGLTLAISSDGRAPALVALLRRALEQVIPDEISRWVDLAEQTRREWRSASVPFTERRPRLLRALNALYDGPGNAP